MAKIIEELKGEIRELNGEVLELKGENKELKAGLEKEIQRNEEVEVF